MKQFFSILLTLALLLGLTACDLFGGTDKQWQEQYDLGMHYLEDGDCEEAILAFTAAIEIDGNRPEAYIGRARAYVSTGETEKALKDYKKAKNVAKNSDEDYDDLVEELEKIIDHWDEEFDENRDGETHSDTVAPKNLTKILAYSVSGDQTWLKAVYFFAYDAQGNLASRRVEEYSETGNILNEWGESYSYDSFGNVTAICDLTTGEATRSFTYDPEGRLLSVQYDYYYGIGVVHSYVYDDVGNLLRREDSIGYETVEYTCENGQILGATSTYAGGYTYTYRFTYDDRGRLATETTNGSEYGVETIYSYDYFDLVSYYNYPTMLESSFNIAMWDAYGTCLWSMEFAPDSILTVENGYLLNIEDGSEWYGPGIYTFIYEDETGENTTPSGSDDIDMDDTEPENADVYTLYKTFFYSHYTDSDMVYLADVTQDGQNEMLVVQLSDAEGTQIFGHVYTIVDGVVTEIYSNYGSSSHAGGFYSWYLTKAAGVGYNLCEESYQMWQGYGTLSYWEYTVNPDGTTRVTYEIAVTGDDTPVDDESYDAYIATLRQRLSGCYALYYTHSEGGGAPLLDTSPTSVFDH